MAASHHALLAKNEYQLRLLAFLNEGADKLRFIFHNPVQGNLPNDQTELYKALLPFKKKLNHLGKDQLAVIFPPDQKTNSKLFDITLLCDLLINCTNIQPPGGGWRVRVLKEKDLSTGADIIRIKILRNKIIHGRRLDVSEFLNMWDELESVLRRMGYDVSNVKDLKTGCLNNLELFKVSLLQSEFEILKFNYQQDIQQNKQNIELTQQGVQKNKENLQQTKEDVQETAKDMIGAKQDLQETKTEVLATKIDVQETKQALIETTEELQETLENVAEIKEDVQQTKQSVYDNQQEISNTVQELAQTKHDVQQTNRDMRHTILDVQRNQHNIYDNNVEIYQTKKEAQQTKQDVQQTKQDVQQTKRDVRQTQGDIQQTKQDVRQTQGDMQQTKQEVRQTQGDMQQTKQDVRQTQEDMQQTKQDVRQTQEDMQQTKQDVRQTQGDMQETKRDVRQAKEDIQRTKQDLQQTTDDVRQTKLDVQETKEDVRQTKLHVRQTKQDVQQTNQDVPRRTQEIQRDILESRQDLKQGMLQNQREIQRSIIDLRETLKQSERKSENLHDHDERNDRADKSYSIYTNCEGKIIVKFAKVIEDIQLEIHSDDDGSTRVLREHVDFMEKVNKGSMYIKLMTSNEFAEEKLKISSLQDLNYSMILPIEATPHLYRSIFDCNNEIKISTHGYNNVFDLIEHVKQMSVEKHFVQYDASGSKKITKLPLSMWYDVCLNLIKTFYGQDNIVKERMQFHASKFGGEISNLAFWLTDNLKDIKNGIFSIITDYNSEDHLVFLNHNIDDANQRSDSYDHKGRILVVYPCPNIILNVRYTKSAELYDVEVELTKGESDIRNLLLVNEILVRNRNFIYANIVAAPNFVKDEESLTCAGCHVMDKTIMEDKSRLEKWFESIIGEISEHEKTFDKSVCETGYLKLISQIFGFLATRRSNKHGASILGLDAAKQMRSLMLNAEQLKVLYSEERKKIVVGNFGSGKTLVGSYQLQHLAENAVAKTKIYYICWDSRSMLVQDIKNFIRSLSTKKCACVHAVTVVDLCKELKLTNPPSLPYLISQLLKEHGGDWLMHFIVDEYDCEELSHDVAQDLCNTMKVDFLKDSFVTILPHSAKRNRTLISSDEKFHHEKYQYEATGMKIFYLSKCMRTTKRNYQLIKRFEQRICDQKIHFKHPREPQENRKLEKHTSNESSDARMSDMTSISMLPVPQTSSELPIFPNNNPIFEASLDLDTIAAVQPNTPVNPNMATITQLEYPQMIGIGHNIYGNKPDYIILKTKKLSEYEVIARLAIVLEEQLNDAQKNKLILCNTSFHQYIMENVLQVLHIPYYHFHESSDACVDHECILTNYAGARGREAEQVFLCVDPTKSELKHLILECMTRSSSQLHLVALAEPRNKQTQQSSGSVLKTITKPFKSCISRTTVGDILNGLAREGLVKVHSVRSVTTKASERPLIIKRKNSTVNTNTPDYKHIIEELEEQNARFTGTCCVSAEEVPNTYTMLQSPVAVTNVKCLYQDNSTCLLTWKPEGFMYIIHRKDQNSVQYELSRTSSGSYVVQNLVPHQSYLFSVTASSNVGTSNSFELHYKHAPSTDEVFKRLESMIENNDIEGLKRLRERQPDFLYLRDDSGWTPLFYASWNNKPSVVKLFINIGCDLGAVDFSFQSSYHLSARAGHAKVLNILCQYDVTCLNQGDDYNRTPLYFASLHGNIACVDTLLRHNAGTAVMSSMGESAYDVAGEQSEEKRHVIQKMIEDHMSSLLSQVDSS